MISIGYLAKTYGILPSEVAARATTYDIMVTDVYTTWENHKRNPDDLKHLDQTQLQQILDKAKNGGRD
jgi:hypothetical protein